MSVAVAVLAALTVGALAWTPNLWRPRRTGVIRQPRAGGSGPLSKLGRWVRRWDPLDRWLGHDITDSGLALALVFLAPAVALAPAMLAVGPCALAGVVVRRRRARIRVELADLERGLPDVIDLISLGVGAGLTLRHSLTHGVAWFPAPFREVFGLCVRRNADGEPLVESLDHCVPLLGDPCRPLLRVLIAAERDGAALLPALERAGQEARRRRRVQAEERARKVPVAMLFPLVLCVLPAFALLSIVPLLLGTLADLELPG